MTVDELRARADAVKWWHSGIELGHGIVTRGTTNPAVTLLPYLRLPADMTGLSVADICTWDGYMAFECERRGAWSVVAVDSFAWEHPGDPLTGGHTGQAGFNLAHEARQSKVMPVVCDVLDLSKLHMGTFDVVLFLGVLYHMRHPLLALEKVATLAHDLLIVETLVDMTHIDTPVMRFYPGAEINNDPTNWWGPNPACVCAMLIDAGFARVEWAPASGTRAVFHAYRKAAT